MGGHKGVKKGDDVLGELDAQVEDKREQLGPDLKAVAVKAKKMFPSVAK